jgi:hypothetical protein
VPVPCEGAGDGAGVRGGETGAAGGGAGAGAGETGATVAPPSARGAGAGATPVPEWPCAFVTGRTGAGTSI